MGIYLKKTSTVLFGLTTLNRTSYFKKSPQYGCFGRSHHLWCLVSIIDLDGYWCGTPTLPGSALTNMSRKFSSGGSGSGSGDAAHVPRNCFRKHGRSGVVWDQWTNKQRVLMHRHQGLNVRHGLCHIYMRYLYIYELFIAFVCFVVCSLL